MAEPFHLAQDLAMTGIRAHCRLIIFLAIAHRYSTDKDHVNELDLGLRNALDSGNCVLFVGSGIGMYATDKDGRCAPDACHLADELADHFKIHRKGHIDLAKVAQLVEVREGRNALDTFLTKRFADLFPNEVLQSIFSRSWRAIFTTNYDNTIERAYELTPDPARKIFPISLSSQFSLPSPTEAPVVHIHGSILSEGSPSLVITEGDYARFREKRRMLFEFLKLHLASFPFLYLGYSNTDPNWKLILSELLEDFYPKSLPTSYRVARETDDLDRELLSAQGIITIDATIDEFARIVQRELGQERSSKTYLEDIQSEIPSSIRAATEKNLVATYRLASSWLPVNDIDFSERPNVEQFLAGDLPNWSLVSQRLFFERDIEEPIYDDLLDYVTSESPGVRVFILLGPAGYGISTVLRSLACRIVKDRAGRSFFLKQGAQFLPGDIEFSITALNGTKLFFVDNAADHSEPILLAVQRCREMKLSACFILGDRLNEWRQRHPRLRGKEYGLEALSDAEIERLIDCLQKQNALGVLTGLERTTVASTIKHKHQNQLLVTMREVTEGKAFDAIIEDEFRSIENERSRQLYAVVSGFYRLRVLARDQALSAILDASIEEIYGETKEATEGVVMFEALDRLHGIFGARTRHHVIAEIVWGRCVERHARETIMLKALESLNLSFHVDRQAFEAFVRHDEAVESITGFEAKTKFFEIACKKEPDNAYIRQHYARMLLREGHREVALAEIEKALQMQPDTRVFHHTKATVLRDIALESESKNVGLRRLAQSEHSYRQALRLGPRDEYAYQGLAELYFRWAKQCDSEDEEVDYLAKAEEVITEGLQLAREKQGLWIVSADIHQYLGNKPKAIEGLKKAIEANPNTVIARYLLARIYRSLRQPRNALEILKPVINQQSNEYRSCTEYALALVEVGENYDKAIAVMNLSTVYGYRDARFIAILGGLNFMAERYNDADKVFRESRNIDLTFEELTRTETLPLRAQNDSTQTALRGTVKTLKPGYAFIAVAGMPDFFCPGTKFGNLVLSRGMKVTFEPAFTARGPVAKNVMPLSEH